MYVRVKNDSLMEIFNYFLTLTHLQFMASFLPTEYSSVQQHKQGSMLLTFKLFSTEHWYFYSRYTQPFTLKRNQNITLALPHYICV
jgi:ribonucleotide reductase beta subunit family protein with ferritin-like domain